MRKKYFRSGTLPGRASSGHVTLSSSVKSAHGQWFSPASSTTKSGRHDIAEILLKVALNTINQIKSFN
jgi:hypothetical protein